MESEEQNHVDEARKLVEAMAWPDPETVTKGVTTLHDARTHNDHLNTIGSASDVQSLAIHQPLDYVESGGWTYARAIQQAMVDIANTYGDDCVFIGEDMEVAGAFGMNMALKNAGHQEKLVDMPLCEAIIVHTGVGTALSGMRPMVEIQFGGSLLWIQCARQ